MAKKSLFLLLTFQVLGSILSLKVIPTKPGHIVLYWVNGTLIIDNKEHETNFNIYFKESEERNGTFEAIIRNVFLVDPTIADDKSNPLAKLLYFANRKFYITWDDFNMWIPGEKDANLLYYSLANYWTLLNYSQDLVDKVKVLQDHEIKNLTNLLPPSSACDYFVQLEANVTSFNIYQKMSYGRPCLQVSHYGELYNYSNFYSDDPHFEFEIYDTLFKDDLTINSRQITFKTVNETEQFEGRFEMFFKEFYKTSEKDAEFSPRPTVLENTTLDLKSLLPFVDDYDLKFKSKLVFNDRSGIVPVVNCSFDLFVRHYSYSSTQVYAKVENFVFHNLKNGTPCPFKEDLKQRIERFVVAGFTDEGVYLYKYLDEDTYEKFIDLHPIIRHTLILDRASLELIQKQKPEPIEVKVNLTDVGNVGKDCKVRRSYDLTKYETHLEIDTAKTCKKIQPGNQTVNFSDLKLDITQRLVPYEYKLIGQTIKLQWNGSIYGFHEEVKMVLDTQFYAYVPKSETDEDVFKLNGAVINDEFLNLKHTDT